MAHDETDRTDRRKFLQAGALATASAVSLTPGPGRARAGRQDSRAPQAEAGQDRHRGFDARGGSGAGATNASSGSPMPTASGSSTPPSSTAPRRNFKKWFEQDPKVRKEIVVVTKDMPRTPKDMLTMVDERLAALGTDYIDLFFIHGLGDERTVDESINMVTSQEFKETADAIRKSGKAKFIGFSTHNKDRAPIIEAAAKAGYHRRDHAPVPALARQGLPAQQGARCLLEERDRPDLDEADRRQRLWRQAQGRHPQGSRRRRCRCWPSAN